MTNALTRRAVVAGAAAAPALTIPALADLAPDPIFNLIEEHRRADAAYTQCVEVRGELERTLSETERQTFFYAGEVKTVIPTDDPRWIQTEFELDRIYRLKDGIAFRFLDEPPTTIAGVAALLRYAYEVAADGGPAWPDRFPDDPPGEHNYDWSLFLHRSLADALESIARKAVQS
jgi:hypothetical protein